MAVIKLYNKILLREHPDLSPIDDPSFEKGHSFIFPGDEIVMISKISSDDFGPYGLLGVTPTSVKMSIIAKKLNIYSEEYSEEYAATRSFELDSVTVPFTPSNAPLVPWGTDGYAPNINFTQDRPWALPSGDFRRQIKAFTEHTNGTSDWDFNFWFPFIFNERYWLALAQADNDFYDTGEPQNGKNDKWLRYHDLSIPPFGWKIFMKIEFNYNFIDPTSDELDETEDPFTGLPYTLSAEYSLSNEQEGIQDYESNPDYALLSIKTSPVDGTPSNSPAYIFGDQNTSVFGYFTKQSAWDVGEEDTLTGVLRIRPFEGGDRLGSRGSSRYAATTDVVWVANEQLLSTSDGGVIISTDFGEDIAIDDNGIPVTVTVTGLDIVIQGEIDYQKLAIIFPGVNTFTIYARLYNGTVLLGEYATSVGSFNISGNQFVEDGATETYIVDGIGAGYTLDSVALPNGWTIASTGVIAAGSQSFDFNVGIGSGTIIITYADASDVDHPVYLDVYSGATRMGEEIMQDGVIFVPPDIPLPAVFCEDTSDCVFPLNVFADPDDTTNFNNNDKTDFYLVGNAGIDSMILTLQKYIYGSWTDIETIIDNTFGSFFAFGKNPDFSGSDFVDDFNKQYTGVLLEWYKVYLVHGVGRYRMKITQIDIFDEVTDSYSKAEYCLKKYNCHNTDGTIKIETLNQGLRGTLDNNTIQIDYGTGWRSEIRLRGRFEQLDPAYNREYNQYGDASYNAFKPIIDEQVPKYKSDIKPVPGWMDWYLSTNVLQADQILITDYNSKGRHSLVRVPVKDGEIVVIPETKRYPNPLAAIELKFAYGQNNLRKRNS